MKQKALDLVVGSCLLLTSCENDTANRQPSKVIVANWPTELTTPQPPPPPQQPRFALYKTENLYTLLLLDTQTGRIWQAQYAMNEKAFRGVVSLSTAKLAEGDNGRFALTKTENLWTFVLTDTANGRLWQCQFALTEQNVRGCIPMDLTPKQ